MTGARQVTLGRELDHKRVYTLNIAPETLFVNLQFTKRQRREPLTLSLRFREGERNFHV